jgi:hypothetical protein
MRKILIKTESNDEFDAIKVKLKEMGLEVSTGKFISGEPMVFLIGFSSDALCNVRCDINWMIGLHPDAMEWSVEYFLKKAKREDIVGEEKPSPAELPPEWRNYTFPEIDKDNSYDRGYAAGFIAGIKRGSDT